MAYKLEIINDNDEITEEIFEKQIDIVKKYGIGDRSLRKSITSNKFRKGKDYVYRCSYVLSNEDKVNIEKNIMDFGVTKDRILVIGDIHEPFSIDGYLEFCKHQYDKYNCNTVVFIGDIIDNHALSYWESNPDGMSSGQELKEAKIKLKKWHDTFPNAYVIQGNHCILPYRKAFSGGMSREWIKDMKEVLKTPSWTYGEEFIINNILFYHGEGLNPKAKSIQEMISSCGGHNHATSYIHFSQGRLPNTRIFGMQLGTGIDSKKYAFAYGKHNKPAHINCGIILNKTPIIEYMET